MIDDKLSKILTEDGFVLQPVQLTPHNPDSIHVGYRFFKEHSEFICRVDEEDKNTVILVFYKAIDQKKGMHSGFHSVLWLANYLKEKGFLTLKGYVFWDSKKYPKGTHTDKMIQFYKKIGGQEVFQNNQQWIVYNLSIFTRLRDLIKHFGKEHTV